MRKVLGLAVGICLIGTLGFMVTGCGQATPTINTSNSQPQGLKIKGVVRALTRSDTTGDPVAGATVWLSGDSANQTTTTNANGEYLFQNIPDGDYIVAVTAEGYTRNSSTSVPIKPSSNIPADNTISVADIRLSSRPIIISYSPNPNSIISTSQTFVVKFNEPMDVSTVVLTLAPSGLRTFAGQATVPITVSWDASSKEATITPQGALSANCNYALTCSTNATDISGFPITTNAEQALGLSPTFRVNSGGVPGAPSDITIVIGTITLESADYSTVFPAGSVTVGFHWTPSSGNVTGYKVYVATSSTGNFSLIGTSTTPANWADVSMNNILTALYGTSTGFDPLGTANYPLINVPLYVKVIAYNGDGESAAVVGGPFKEKVGPQRTGLNAAYSAGAGGYAGAVLGNNYYLPSIKDFIADPADKGIAYVFINQPVDPTTVSGNIEITGVTLTATLLTQSSSDLGAIGGTDMAVIKIDAGSTDIRTLTVTLKTGLKDLAGNPVVSGTGDTITLPP